MNMQDFAGEIERTRTMLQANYRNVTVSASIIRTGAVFVSVKSPHWTHEMEWREGDAPEMLLSEWICEEVLTVHEPDIAKAAHAAEGE